MLKEYLRLCQSDLNFDVAKGVFLNFDEGKVLDPLDRSKELGKRDERLARISEAMAALVTNRGNRGNEYHFMAHWTGSPFGRLQCKGGIPRYSSWTKDRTTPMKCPVPPETASPTTTSMKICRHLYPAQDICPSVVSSRRTPYT
ncbi:hypothetical protein SeMB42_g07026 [Synchytrium endobioticum]|uniref:Uncharacterized protein n=1 Tax=Synchytrium endobioticum TaxID=286115 RepID=A0A507CBW1_9FUNG|nr:hypothetical protein SeMB42_g07026 [Synchytrium endobioticum]TPX44692.1 hypothetical protein SeLEV6574_g04341 [Synchytrium endobioticum]